MGEARKSERRRNEIGVKVQESGLVAVRSQRRTGSERAVLRFFSFSSHRSHFLSLPPRRLRCANRSDSTARTAVNGAPAVETKNNRSNRDKNNGLSQHPHSLSNFPIPPCRLSVPRHTTPSRSPDQNTTTRRLGEPPTHRVLQQSETETEWRAAIGLELTRPWTRRGPLEKGPRLCPQRGQSWGHHTRPCPFPLLAFLADYLIPYRNAGLIRWRVWRPIFRTMASIRTQAQVEEVRARASLSTSERTIVTHFLIVDDVLDQDARGVDAQRQRDGGPARGHGRAGRDAACLARLRRARVTTGPAGCPPGKPISNRLFDPMTLL